MLTWVRKYYHILYFITIIVESTPVHIVHSPPNKSVNIIFVNGGSETIKSQGSGFIAPQYHGYHLIRRS